MAKSKYRDDFPARAEAYAKQGLIDKEIAQKLGVSEKTYYDYQNKYPQFLQALKRGKEPIDQEVEQCLLKRARGFEYEETHIEYKELPGPGVTAKPTSVKKIKKLIIGDVTAQIFWLKNRMPERWKDKQAHEFIGPIPVILSNKFLPKEANGRSKSE